jgi:SAM-dependent methyltransferase
VKLPELDPVTGFIPTLNRMGGMSPTLDEFSRAFAEHRSEWPLLDVGACYGVTTRAALENGATVWANDLLPAHLDLLEQQIQPEHRGRLRILPGAFPADIPWHPESLGAVLLARVLHYLDGPAIEQGLREVARALVPGGKVYGVAVTPFLAKLVPFQPEYQERKQVGERWPGAVEVARFDPANVATLPPTLHLLDAEVLTRELQQAGLQVERMEYFSRPAFLDGLACDGRETLGFVALRP